MIPTAKEFLFKNIDYFLTKDCKEDIHNAMIEFAKLHVKAALEAAWDNFEFEEGCDTHGVSLKEESILNAYPETLIK